MQSTRSWSCWLSFFQRHFWCVSSGDIHWIYYNSELSNNTDFDTVGHTNPEDPELGEIYLTGYNNYIEGIREIDSEFGIFPSSVSIQFNHYYASQFDTKKYLASLPTEIAIESPPANPTPEQPFLDFEELQSPEPEPVPSSVPSCPNFIWNLKFN